MNKHISTASLAVAAAALATACPQSNPPLPEGSGYTCEGELCTVTGPILTDVTFTADKKWVLTGGVFVGDDADPDASPAILTIEPGTTVYGDTAALSFLLVTRGSKLVADGRADAPIVFTSAKDAGSRARGDWGGLVINGQAPVNGCTGDPCVVQGEAGTGTYGGAVANDDSGVLRYVRVEFGGALIDDENELNGFAFQGVGSGTVIENIQAHLVSDDCIEFFGGTASAKRILCTGAGDDNLDWTFGWTGKVQFLIAQQYDDAGGNGIEADNNEANNELTPVSRPVISNATFIGRPASENSKIGVLLRRGTQAELHNVIVMGFNDRCFDMDDSATFAGAVEGDALTGNTVIENSIFDCATLSEDEEGDAFSLEDFLLTMNEGNEVGDPGLTAPDSVGAADFRPAAGSLASSGGQVPSDSFFEAASYRGACPADDNWAQGWAAFPQN